MEDLNKSDLDRKKRFFKRYKKNLALIERLEEKLYTLDERISGIKSPTWSDVPKGGVPVTTLDLLADKAELENRINRLVAKGKILKSEIVDKIDELDDIRYAEVLEAFFIDCKDFDTIADESGYTTRHVIRLYSEALSIITL